MSLRRGISSWQPTAPLGWLRRAAIRWLSWSPRRKAYSVAAFSLLALVIVFVYFLWSGVTAALEARDRFEELEVELSHLSPVDLLQVDIYQSLAGRFQEAEQSAGRARSRLRFVRLFTWLPGAGGRIQESRTKLEMAYFLARGGRNLAIAYQGALETPLDELDAEEAAQRVSEALEKAVPRLIQVERDLQEARRLREELGDAGLSSRYGSIIDIYLPQIQTVTYISRVSPQVIGQSYVLNRELTAVGDLATDPLQVLSNPAEVGQSLDIIVDGSRRLAAALEVVERSAKENTSEPVAVREEVLRVIELMQQSATLLENATAGSQGLLDLAEAMEEQGFLSREFGVAASSALTKAEARLALARDETKTLRATLARQDRAGEDTLASLLFTGDPSVSLSSVDRLEVLLERAVASTRFLQTFLGLQGPRTYLVLGQNQQEIRATGGFIGVAVQTTLDQGELVDIVYHDSTTVDPLPPEYPLNPQPPPPIKWYLWMGRLLFRDANWSPHFPSSAAQVADLYRLGQGVRVDGVLTGSKKLMVDIVDLLGDVRVPDLEEPLTRETATAYTDGDLPYQCRPDHVSTRGKRCFDEDAFFALRDRMTSQISGEERVAVVELLKASLDRSNILLHVFDPEEGGLLWEMGWNGAIQPVDHDYLLVVDSSLPGHIVKAVRRHWDYQVSLQVGQPVDARLRVRYEHDGVRREDRVCRQSEPQFYNCYWNYIRVYVPRTATNVQMPPVPLHQGSERLIWGYPVPDSRSLVTRPTWARPG